MSREAHVEPVSGPGVDHGAASPTIPSRSILVVGLPRSGTTWIGKIFDSHPRTLYLHEPDSAVPMNGIPLIAESMGPGIDQSKSWPLWHALRTYASHASPAPSRTFRRPIGARYAIGVTDGSQ